MGVFLTVDVIATVAGSILSGKNAYPHDGASGIACWNSRNKVDSGRRFSYYLYHADTGRSVQG